MEDLSILYFVFAVTFHTYLFLPPLQRWEIMIEGSALFRFPSFFFPYLLQRYICLVVLLDFKPLQPDL